MQRDMNTEERAREYLKNNHFAVTMGREEEWTMSELIPKKMADFAEAEIKRRLPSEEEIRHQFALEINKDELIDAVEWVISKLK